MERKMKKRADSSAYIFLMLFMVYGLLSCHTFDEEKPEVEGLEFVNENVKMKIGERQAIKIEVSPKEARKYAGVTYMPSVEGYITIAEQSNDGCVITAERGGVVVLVAKAGSYTAYLEVKIEGDQFLQVPYIMVPNQVIEILEGSRKTAQVNLYNGSAVDQQLFEWEVEPGKDIISINPTGNTVVVQGEKRGSQKIFIKHAKSEYRAEILVFVVGINEQARYITTKQNVITMVTGGASHDLVATLAGAAANTVTGFTFSIPENEIPCVELITNNTNTCTIIPKSKGSNIINIHHMLCEYDLQVRVIVSEGEENYIEVDPTFKILDIGQSVMVNAKLNGFYLESWNNDWEAVKRGDTEAVTVTQANNQFFVEARQAGRCVLEIKNKNIQYARECLVVVRDPSVVPADEYYITTSQNVIQMEAGQDYPVQLNIQLINGIEPDKNNFTWTVEDGTIIQVDPLDQTSDSVTYLRRRQRAVSEIKGVANTIALVTAKKVGVTRVVVEIEKAGRKLNSAVIVKVYPKGTFGGLLYILGRKEGGLIKVDTTVQAQTGKDMPVELYIMQPANASAAGLGKVDWKVEPRNQENPQIVASIMETMQGLENEIHGTGRGINRLIVSKEEVLKYPFEATVMVGTTEELAEMAVLYVDQAHQTVATGQNCYVQILNSNMKNGLPNLLSESAHYTAKYYDKGIVNAVMVKNRLMLQGINEGITTVTVANDEFPEALPVDVKVTVLPGFVTIDKPYMLTSSVNFIGMNWGQSNKEMKVTLSGENNMASDVEKGRIKWASSNRALVKVTGNGETALLSAGDGTMPDNIIDMTGQANVTASHDKSINEKVTVVYVVPPGVDPENVVVLGIAKEHWLLQPGDEIMLNLITNADDSDARNINQIGWYNKEGFNFAQGAADNIIEVDCNGASAMVRAKAGAQGSTHIRVSHPKKVIDLMIYISVSSTLPMEKTITLPAIVEIIVNENKVVTAVCQGMEQADINKIEWTTDDDTVAVISTDLPLGTDDKKRGGKLYIKGRKKGQAYITARQDDIGFVKRILLVCANTYEELLSTYVLATDESYIRMRPGDVKFIKLVYGSAGFPPSEKAGITWDDMDKNNVIKIHPPQMDFAEIEATAEGIARVKIDHRNIFKAVELTFEVSKEMEPGEGYKFEYNGMMGLVIYDGQTEGGKSLEYEEPYTKTAVLGIKPIGLSFNQIEFADEENPDKGVVSVQAGGTGDRYLITGRKEGKSYIKFHHKSGQVPDDARIFVYTARTLTELQQMFPIAVNKNNYLLNKNDPAEEIKISVPTQGAMGLSDTDYKAKLNKIGWDYYSSGNNVISYTIDESKMETFRQTVKVTPKNVGNCYFEVKYDGKLVDKIFISVREKSSSNMNVKIVTENIIGLTPGEFERKTSIGTNLTKEQINDNLNGVEWRVLNSSIADIKFAPNDRSSCLITAKGKGNTEIVVSYGSIERYIKVYVTDAPELYKEVNLDNRYYQLRKNDILPITAFHAALAAERSDEWDFYPLSNPFDNKVAELKPVGKDKVEITGINEGIATIVLHNGDCATDVTFMVEVNSSAPLIEGVYEDWYMTAVKTVYALDPAKTMDSTRIQVNGVRFTSEETAKIEWSVVSEEIDGAVHTIENEPGYKPVLLTLSNRKGSFIEVMPNNKTGTAVLRATHARSVNDMDITVICNKDMIMANPVPHIAVDQETVKLQLNEEADVIMSIEDLPGGYDIGQFTAKSDNEQKVTVEVVGNRLKVKGVNFGQALVSIEHPKVPGFIKKIIVIVMSGDTELVYLTTKQNFVQIEKNNFAAVEVELVGYTDLNNRNYIWSTDDSDIISINDSGRTAVITAKNVTRTAKIMVQHIACLEYPLFIYARVTEKNTGNPTYISTQNNIVAIKEGAGIQIKAALVNGGGQELSLFNWTTNNRNIIELNFANDSALVKGITPGTALINIWHPSSLNSLNVLVVVEPLEPNNGIYITTDSQLIEMTTGENQRIVRARLVGGVPEDIYGFQWQVTQFSSVGTGQSIQPITILANADTCYIQPVAAKYEGEATITISHPKTSYKLDVKVLITDATEVKFSQPYITMDQYSQVTVPITAPVNGGLNVAIQQSATSPVIQVYAASTMCVLDGLREGTAIVRISNVSGTKSDEMVVRVNKVNLNGFAYINILDRTIWTKTLRQTQQVSVQILGAQTETEQQQILQKLEVTISNSQVLSIKQDWGRSRVGQVWTWELEIEAIKTGAAEVEFYIQDTAANASIFEKYPDLKGMVKKIYFKVNEGNNVYSVDKSDIQMYEGSVGEMITASIDIGVERNILAENIQWSVHYPAGETKKIVTIDECRTPANPNNTAGNFYIRVNAEDVGSCWIEANFGNKEIKVITIKVNPVDYIRTDRTTIQIGPDIPEYFTIFANPPTAKITYQANGNMGIKEDLYGRPNGSDDSVPWTKISEFYAGANGYTIKVIGSELQGSVRLTFSMPDRGKSTQIFITNLKNYYARWIDKQSLRFTPDEPDMPTEKTKIYYETNPIDDDLENNSDNSFDTYFKINKGADSNGRFIWLSRPDTNKDYFPPCIYDQRVQFKTVKTNQILKLSVFVYYDKIDVKWKPGSTNIYSEFDDVTYAIKLAKGDPVKIKLDTEPPGNAARIKAISWVYSEGGKTEPAGVTANFNDINAAERLLTVYGDLELYTGDDDPGIGVHTGTDYKGILEVKYQYSQGGTPVQFTRKFLIYAKRYKKQNLKEGGK